MAYELPEERKFSITVEDDRIIVNDSGRSYEGFNAGEISAALMRSGNISIKDAFYLGRELQKAETAVQTGSGYEQDKNLRFLVPQHNQIVGDDPIDIDGKRMQRLPTHGRLISIKRLEDTKEAILTYIVNDREIPTPTVKSEEEDKFKEFLRGIGMSRVF